MSSNSTTYTNCSTLISADKANTEAFHKRLQQLYPCVDDVTKLPQAWSSEAKAQQLCITYDNLGCYFRGNGRRDDDDKFAAAVRTDHFIPPSCLLYYFEVTFISKGREGFMGIGLTAAHGPNQHSNQLSKLPGWASNSYGYHADDGNKFSGEGRGKTYGPTYTSGDVIGCGYNLVEGKCFFTKNGLSLGEAFGDIPRNILLYPTIGLKTPGEETRANFGQEKFVYNIEQDLRYLRKKMTLTISNYPISDFGNWQSTLHKLVQSWLLQNSYPSTADAFTKSAKMECKENLQRIQQRKCIQQLVLNGRISEAIRQTNRLCPNLLQNNPNLLFALKCRQFIELISGAESDYQPTIASFTGGSSDNPYETTSNGLKQKDTNGDRLTSSSETSSSTSNNCSSRNLNNNNGYNGSINSIDNNSSGDLANRTGDQQSASLQELMEIDQPIPNIGTNNEGNHRTIPTTTTTTNNTDNNNGTSFSNNGISTNNNNNNPSSGQTNNHNKIINGSNDSVGVGGDEMEIDDDKSMKLIQFGQELSDYLQHLDKLYGKNELNEKMLQDTIGLIAYTDPRKSSFGKLLDPTEREPVSQLLNSTIVKAEMGDSYRPPLEDVVNHLRKLVKLNDSHGRWLVERLY